MMRPGLGDTCQWPQPGVTMVYPPCDPATLPAGTQAPIFPVAPTVPATAQVQPGRLSFQNLTTGNSSQFQVGDRWQLQISGASPNTPVTLTGSNPKGSMNSSMGSTDGQGNFARNGQITADQIGAWQESWFVGGQPSGAISFTVAGNADPTQPKATVPKLPVTTSTVVGLDGMGLLLIGGAVVALMLLTRR